MGIVAHSRGFFGLTHNRLRPGAPVPDFAVQNACILIRVRRYQKRTDEAMETARYLTLFRLTPRRWRWDVRTQPGLPVILWLACAFALTHQARGQNSLLESNIELKRAVYPLYLSGRSEPVGVFRADHIFTDHQSRGFFRIGALPMVVVERFILEVHSVPDFALVLSNATAPLKMTGPAKKAVEAREFSLKLASSKEPLLHARRARLESPEAWRLQDGVVVGPEATSLRFSRGKLVVIGPQAGEFFGETTNGTIRIDLVSVLERKIHNPQLRKGLDEGDSEQQQSLGIDR
jgi:hypothetical protein